MEWNGMEWNGMEWNGIKTAIVLVAVFFLVFYSSAANAAFVPVADIINVPMDATTNVPLTLKGNVSPSSATNQYLHWSVKNAGTTGAALSGDTLTATGTGTVIVTASVANDPNGNWEAVYAGQNYTIAIRRDGSLWACGVNDKGQLGDSTNIQRLTLVRVGSDNNWAAADARYQHTIAIKKDGSLYAWGYNGMGMLGDNTKIDKNKPTQVGSADNWAAAAVGGSTNSAHTIAIRADGSLYVWGCNYFGEIGNGSLGGSAPNQTTPQRVGALYEWASFEAGANHNIAIKKVGTLWVWGSNQNGQLGLDNSGTGTHRPSPQQVGRDDDWATVIAGSAHSIAIKKDGSLWAWGFNNAGQVGDDTTLNKTTPVLISTSNDWKAVVARYRHNLAIKTDGSLWAWGLNNSGQLGDGTATNRSIPTRVGTAYDWVVVAAGENHSMGIKIDGSLWAWGNNSSGQFGDNTKASCNAPVLLNGYNKDFTITVSEPSSVTYTVTFLDWDGNVIDTQTVVEGNSATAPADPVRTGHTFIGWDPPVFSNITDDLTVKAQYKINTYTVIFMSDGVEFSSQEVEHGKAAVDPGMPTKTGYTFTGWIPSDFTNITGDLTVNAKFDVNDYTVTFKDHDGTVLKTHTVSFGSGATAPADPIREGYTFIGWDKNFDIVSENITVTAQYKPDSGDGFTVTFVDWNGDVLKKVTVSSGAGAVAPADPARVGYTFSRWDRDFSVVTGDLTVTALYVINKYTVIFIADGVEISRQTIDHGGAAAAPGAPVKTGYVFTGWDRDFSVITGDLTVAAVFVANKYTVVFISDGAEFNRQTVDHGSAAVYPGIPVKAGYTFTGWDTNFSNVTGNLTVTALFEPGNKYTVVFLSDGIEFNRQTVEPGGSAANPGAPSKAGHTFTGWDKVYTNITSSMTVNAMFTAHRFTVIFMSDGVEYNRQTVEYGAAAFNPGSPVKAGHTFAGWDKIFSNITGDLTVNALFNINHYTVTFVSWNGEVLLKQTVPYGAGAAAPEAPVRDGHTFRGWSTDFSHITGNLTVRALYDTDKFAVAFVDWDGAVLKLQVVEYCSGAAAPADPVRAGYTFTGWDVNFSHIIGNLTVTAQYKSNTTASYTVYFVANRVVINHQYVEQGSSAIAPADPARAGYTFIGWDKNFSNIRSNLTVIAQFKSNTAVSHNVVFMANSAEFSRQTVEHQNDAENPGVPAMQDCTFSGWDKSYSNVTSDLTVSAQFKAIANPVYTVIFMANGEEFSRQAVEQGSAAHDPGEPFMEGYTFTRWDKGFSNITGDLTVSAQFAINTYTVIFMVDGVVFDRQTVKHGDDAIDPVAPVKEGYIFAGWDGVFTNIRGDLTVTALYENIIYFVPVTDIVGAPDTAMTNTPLTLTGTVIPDNATNKKIVWGIKNAGVTGAAITDDELTASAAGEVVVTAMIWGGVESRQRFANFTKDFTVKVKSIASGISLNPATDMNFGSVSERYGAVNPRAVTVNNIGIMATGALNIALSGKNESSFAVDKTSMPNIAVDGSDSFSVAPITGLKAGTYEATVTVSGGAGIAPQSFNVSFTVNSTSKKGGGGGCNTGFFLGYGLLALLIPIRKIVKRQGL